MTYFLNESQLKHISKHEYSAERNGGSFLENLYLEAYWQWLLGKIPPWLAPNVLSISGLAINIFITALLLSYCPTAHEKAPAPLYLLYAMGMFVYQSLDGIDGPHARRTGNDNPLGELMDHGCDAISIVLFSVGTGIMAQLAEEPMGMFYICFASICLFYCAHWQTYVSGTLKFEKFDAPEMQTLLMLMFLTTGVFGASMWDIQVPFIGFKMRTLLIYGIAVGTVNTAYNTFTEIYCVEKGEKGSTVAGTSVASPTASVLLVIYMACHVARYSNTRLFQTHACLFLLAFGLVLAKMSIKILVATMAKSQIELTDSCMIGGMVQILNVQFGSHLDEHVLLWLMAIHVVFDLFYYCVSVGSQICHRLDINWFTIKNNNCHKVTSNGCHLNHSAG